MLLKQHDLHPNPNYQIVDETPNRQLDKKISRQQYRVNSLVNPGSYVAYKFWKWKQPANASQKPPANAYQKPSAQWQGTWRVTSKWVCHPGSSATWDFTVNASGGSCKVLIGGTSYPCQIRENWIEWKMINSSDNLTLTFQKKQGKSLTGRFDGTRKGYKGNICGRYTGRKIN